MNTHTVILDKLRHSVAHPTLRTFLFYAIIALILIKAMGYSGGKGIDILLLHLSCYYYLIIRLPATA